VIRCGIAGWGSAERLPFYAAQFPLVEVDTTYYGIPARKNVEQWIARTPPGFVFDVKSFSLFTQHPTSPRSLPPELRAQLPAALAEKKNLYLEQLPAEIVDAAWDVFRDALEPFRLAGRLGAVLFQLPPWVFPSTHSLSHIEQCQERMHGYPVAVEFRRREWLDERNAAGTLAFLRSLGIPYVAVDAPQGFPTSMPPVSEITSERLALVRFHGRNHRTWELKGAPPSVRFRHDYADVELGEWVPRIRAMASRTAEVHATFTNSPSDRAAANAKRLGELLAYPPPGPGPSEGDG
jgi:uncharacterized protein YecE (DUF72 family)